MHVTSQSLIYTINKDAGSRLVGGYMVFYSIGSAAGSIASTAMYAWAGWTGVCLLGAAISSVALGFWVSLQHRAVGANLALARTALPRRATVAEDLPRRIDAALGPGQSGPCTTPAPRT